MDAYLETTGFIEQKLLFKKKDGNIYCIGSRNSDKYLYAPHLEANTIYFILHEIDKGKRIMDIMELVEEKYSLTPEDFNAVIQKCKKVGLIKISEKEEIKKDIDEFELMMVKLKEFSLKKMYPIFSFISGYMRIIAAIMTCVIFVTLFFFISYDGISNFPWEDIFSKTNALFYMWVIQFLSLVMHEFSHAIVGYKYGARPKSFSIAIFYYTMLIFYIRLPGIYFQNEKERIKIWIAGVFMNLFLASCFWILFLKTESELKLFFAVGAASNIILILNNILPFFYSDGYYVLTTFLKTPNLRKRSIFQIKKLVKGGLTKENGIYWAYLFITVLASVTVLGGQLLIVIQSVYRSILSGMGFLNILHDYSNLLIILTVGIIGKLIGRVRKRCCNGGNNNG